MNIFKKIIITALLIMPVPAFSAGLISGGFYLGYQYDAGSLSEKDTAGKIQQNVSAGALLRIDLALLFFRTGADFSYPAVSGTTSGNVEKTASYFVEVPVYGGLNIPLRNYGHFYMGGGGSYIFAMGSIETASGTVDINEQLFGWGFITGVETDFTADLSLFFEWEYVIAKSSPVAESVAAGPEDFSMDYSGSRYRIGVVYRLSRYN